MTISQAHAYFDVLIDKYGGTYFTDSEKDSFITQACLAYTKQQLPSAENEGINFDIDQINYNNIYTLVFNTGTTSMNSSGDVTIAAIQTLLNTASSSTEPLMGILNASWTKSGVTYPLKYTKQNNWFVYINNTFKSGATQPRYRYNKISMNFYPVDTTATIGFTLLKQPKTTNLAGGVAIELPEHTHKSIVEMAVDLAGTATRDGELVQLNNAK
jgi:hypothetical protein